MGIASEGEGDCQFAMLSTLACMLYFFLLPEVELFYRSFSERFERARGGGGVGVRGGYPPPKVGRFFNF